MPGHDIYALSIGAWVFIRIVTGSESEKQEAWRLVKFYTFVSICVFAAGLRRGGRGPLTSPKGSDHKPSI